MYNYVYLILLENKYKSDYLMQVYKWIGRLMLFFFLLVFLFTFSPIAIFKMIKKGEIYIKVDQNLSAILENFLFSFHQLFHKI